MVASPAPFPSRPARRRLVAAVVALVSLAAVGARALLWGPVGAAGVGLAVVLLAAEVIGALLALTEAAATVAPSAGPPASPSWVGHRLGSAPPASVGVWIVAERYDPAGLAEVVRSAAALGRPVVLDATGDPRIGALADRAGCELQAIAPATRRRTLDGLLARASDVVVAVPTPRRLDRAAVSRTLALLERSPAVDAVALWPRSPAPWRLDPDLVVVARRSALVLAGGVTPSGELGSALALHLTRRGRRVVSIDAVHDHPPPPAVALGHDADRRRQRVRWALGRARIPGRGVPGVGVAHAGAILDALAPAAALVVTAAPVLVAAGVAPGSGRAVLAGALISGGAAAARSLAGGGGPSPGPALVGALLGAAVPRPGPGRPRDQRAVVDRARLVLGAVAGTQLAALALALSRWAAGGLAGPEVLAVVLAAVVIVSGVATRRRELVRPVGSAAEAAGRAVARPGSDRVAAW